MPSKPIPEQTSKAPKASPTPQDELDFGALDKVTGGVKPAGFKGTKTADPCEGGE